MYDKHLRAINLRFFSFGMADNDKDCVEVVPLIEYKVNKTSQAEIDRKFLVQYQGHGNKFQRISSNGLSSNFPKTGTSSNHCVRILN